MIFYNNNKNISIAGLKTYKKLFFVIIVQLALVFECFVWEEIFKFLMVIIQINYSTKVNTYPIIIYCKLDPVKAALVR